MDNKKNLDKINRELIKIGVSYDELSPKAKIMLIDVENFLNNQKCLFRQNLKKAQNIKFDVKSFCEYKNISRNALYKKGKNGISQYDIIIRYINSQHGNFETYCNKLLRKIYSETDDNKILLDKLLGQQIEFQEIKRKNKELKETIQDLNNKLKTMEKITDKKILN